MERRLNFSLQTVSCSSEQVEVNFPPTADQLVTLPARRHLLPTIKLAHIPPCGGGPPAHQIGLSSSASYKRYPTNGCRKFHQYLMLLSYIFFLFLHFTACGIESSHWHTGIILLLHLVWDGLTPCSVLASHYVLLCSWTDIKSRFEPVPASFFPSFLSS